MTLVFASSMGRNQGCAGSRIADESVDFPRAVWSGHQCLLPSEIHANECCTPELLGGSAIAHWRLAGCRLDYFFNKHMFYGSTNGSIAVGSTCTRTVEVGPAVVPALNPLDVADGRLSVSVCRFQEMIRTLVLVPTSNELKIKSKF